LNLLSAVTAPIGSLERQPRHGAHHEQRQFSHHAHAVARHHSPFGATGCHKWRAAVAYIDWRHRRAFEQFNVAADLTHSSTDGSNSMFTSSL
jgi:hypothetical protein